MWFDLPVWAGVCCCLAIALGFVLSLYIWRGSTVRSRDDPVFIRQRFISTFITSVLATLLVVLLARYDPAPAGTLSLPWYVWFGFQPQGMLLATFVPLLLMMTLFLGPLVTEFLLTDQPWTYIKHRWQHATFGIIDVRNIIVAPVAEEWCFRACMIPFLLGTGVNSVTITFCVPLFFGAAHMHHVIEHYNKQGYTLAEAWVSVLFQLFYTTLFGWISTFFFLRTGHVFGPMLAHMFCNTMGFPDFEEAWIHRRRAIACTAYVVGLVGFCAAIWPLTEPSWYASPMWVVKS